MSDEQRQDGGIQRERRTERMPTFAPLFKLKFYVHSIGNFKLFSEVTITQLLTSIIAAFIVYKVSSVVVGGPWPVALAGAALVFTPRGVSIVEDGGRPPLKEVSAHIRFFWNGFTKSHQYNGIRPTIGREAARLNSMFVYERTVGGVPFKRTSQVVKENLAGTARAMLALLPVGGATAERVLGRRPSVLAGGPQAEESVLAGAADVTGKDVELPGAGSATAYGTFVDTFSQNSEYRDDSYALDDVSDTTPQDAEDKWPALDADGRETDNSREREDDFVGA